MPLLQTPVIPMNGGIDQRPIEMRPLTTADDVVNAIVKPEGIFRRPPFVFEQSTNLITRDPVYDKLSGYDSFFVGSVFYLLYYFIDSSYTLHYYIYNTETQTFINNSFSIPSENPLRTMLDNKQISGFKIIPISTSKILLIPKGSEFKTKQKSFTLPSTDKRYCPSVAILKLPNSSTWNTANNYTISVYTESTNSGGNKFDGLIYSFDLTYVTDHWEVTPGTPLKYEDGATGTPINIEHLYDEGTLETHIFYITGNNINGEYYAPPILDIKVPNDFAEKAVAYISGNVSSSQLPNVQAASEPVVLQIGSLDEGEYALEFYPSKNAWVESLIYSRLLENTETEINEIEKDIYNGSGTKIKMYKIDQDLTTLDDQWIVIDITDASASVQGLAPRYIGNSLSAPDPSFIDYPIVDAFLFQGRLWILTTNSLVASRTNDYLNFYPKSAATLSADDPIDIQIDSGLQKAVLYQDSILIVGKKQQYLVTATQGIFTSTTIAVTPTTSYEITDEVDPVNLGSTVLLVGSNNQLYEYMSKNEVVQTEAISISESYKPTNILSITKEVSQNLVIFKEEDKKYAVLTYKNIGDQLYRVFSRWETAVDFDYIGAYKKLYGVVNDGSNLYIYVLDTGAIDLHNFSNKDNIYLDFQLTPTAINLAYDETNDETTITLTNLSLANTNMHVYLKLDSEIRVFDNTEYTFDGTDITIVLPGDYSSVVETKAVVGYKYTTSVQFQRFVPKDENNNPIVYKRLSYRKFTVHYKGVSFVINYGNGRYKLDNTGHFYDITRWDDLDILEKKIGMRLTGYEAMDVNLETDDIYPLLVSSIEYQMWYQARL